MNSIKAMIISLSVVMATSAMSQETSEYKIYVDDFKSLTVVDGVNVDYYASTDSAGWAVFQCLPEKASEITFQNKSGHLSIQTSANEHPIPGMPLVRVYSSQLTTATNTGDSTLRLMQLVPVEKIKVQVMGNGRVVAYDIDAQKVLASADTGSGNITVTGKADKGKLRNVGLGTVDATGLELDQSDVFVLGSGPIYCTVTDKINVYGIGPGKVYTEQLPKKVSQRSLGVKVVELSTEATTAVGQSSTDDDAAVSEDNH